jgi:hypothetical protein
MHRNPLTANSFIIILSKTEKWGEAKGAQNQRSLIASGFVQIQMHSL